MSADSGWLMSVIGLGIAMASLWMLSRARAVWQKDAESLRTSLARVESRCGAEMNQLREALGSLERGMVSAQEVLREGRLNLTVRSQALQMLRGGSTPETVANSLGIATSEARLLTKVGQVLTVKPEFVTRA